MSTRKLLGGIVLSVVLLAFWSPPFVRDIAKQAASHDWPSTLGTVVTSETYTRKMFSTGLRFRYRIVVEGMEYELGERRAVDLSLYYTFDSDTAFASKHPVGSTVTVFYDPANPKRVTIATGLSYLDFLFAGPLLPALGLVVYRCGRELARRINGARVANS